MTTEQIIDSAIANTTWKGAKGYVKTLKRSGFQCWIDLPEIFASYEKIEAEYQAWLLGQTA